MQGKAYIAGGRRFPGERDILSGGVFQKDGQELRGSSLSEPTLRMDQHRDLHVNVSFGDCAVLFAYNLFHAVDTKEAKGNIGQRSILEESSP